jgi:hypothetical protein
MIESQLMRLAQRSERLRSQYPWVQAQRIDGVGFSH